jgi:glycosyltransferase involved in cell wall biosynthesis
LDVLIRAFSTIQKRHPDWRLWIVGEGPMEKELRALTKICNISEKTFFFGRTSDPYHYYARASIFVLPSIYEGTSNALLEAMSCGLVPVISSAIKDNISFCWDECQVFETGSDLDLAKKILYLIDNKSHSEELSNTARNIVSQFEPDQTFEIWKKILMEAMPT